RPAAVEVHGAGDGDAAALVHQAVARLVDDRIAPRLLLHGRVVPAALDHEIGDDAVEGQAVVEVRIDVAQEVGDRLRRLLVAQSDFDVALIGPDRHDVARSQHLALRQLGALLVEVGGAGRGGGQGGGGEGGEERSSDAHGGLSGG